MEEMIRSALRGELGARVLGGLGDVVDEIYTVILCPVCGEKTLDNHSICHRCGWEYDGFSEDRYSAANGATLAEYRKAYEKIIQEGDVL